MSKLKEMLIKNLTKKQLSLLRTSYDVIGSKEKAVAIIEIPPELKKKEKLIAKAIMQINKNIKSVLKKVSKRKGKYRLKEYKLILGNKNTEVIHKESGCMFKLDPQKVYFSPREASERLRIANQIKKSENVLMMFAGVAPYAIIIAKKTKAKKITCIEINKDACRYARKNIWLNKVPEKIEIYEGNVRKICPVLKTKFDRTIMPLPLEAHKFLDVAIKSTKKNGVIHFYYQGSERDIKKAKTLLSREAKKQKRKIKILEIKKVLPYAPKQWKLVFDMKVY